MGLYGTGRSYLLNRSSGYLPRAPEPGSVALEKKYECTQHETGIFPENAARQIVALEGMESVVTEPASTLSDGDNWRALCLRP